MNWTYSFAMSLDGYIADSEGGVDWLQGYEDALAGFDDFLSRMQVLLMGRKTYEQVLGFGEWPYGTKPTLVIGSEFQHPPRPHVSYLPASTENIRQQATAFGAMEGWIVGGTKTAELMLNAGIMTTLEVFLIPRILGGGTPAFTGLFSKAKLELKSEGRFDSGVVRLEYRVGGGETYVD
ncbi:MAG: dihydrofolate reductase family protein [Candidatus Sumerlaeia bacterium]|nr:dihydrofolate reductase family protein [Candidatus Sumerlaeia bacterium]